jgi:hypothetical protein
MTRRRLFLLALPVALVLLGVGAWVMWKVEANTIRPGMTRQKVEAIVGPPTGFIGLGIPREGKTLCYGRSSALIVVDFNADDVVVGVEETTFLNRLRCWLGLD